MLNAPPPTGGVGSYNHHDIGGKAELRPPLLHANPLGHHVPATLKICQECIKHEPKTSTRCVRGAMRGAFVSLPVYLSLSLSLTLSVSRSPSP